MLPGTEGPPLLKCMQSCFTFEAALLTSGSRRCDLINFGSKRGSGAAERKTEHPQWPSSASFLTQMSWCRSPLSLGAACLRR